MSSKPCCQLSFFWQFMVDRLFDRGSSYLAKSPVPSKYSIGPYFDPISACLVTGPSNGVPIEYRTQARLRLLERPKGLHCRTHIVIFMPTLFRGH